MRYCKFQYNQSIFLDAKGDATPSQALNDAIEFAKTNGLIGVYLNYHGYLFELDPTDNINDKMKDYKYYLSQKQKADH